MSSSPAPSARCAYVCTALVLFVAPSGAGCTPHRTLLPDVRAEVVSVRARTDGGAPERELRGSVVFSVAGAPGASPTSLPEPPLSAERDAESLALAMRLRFAGEPGVQEIVQAALEAAGLDLDPTEARVRRSRRSGWLPDLRLGATRQRGVDASSRGTIADTSTQVGRDDTLRLEASLTFSLSRLAYGADEVAWSRERRAFLDARSSLVREVIELVVRRRRLVVELELLHEDAPEKRIELEEVEALLEVFTNGNFSRMMLERARPP